MPETHTRLLVVDQAAIEPEILQRLSVRSDYERIAAGAPIPLLTPGTLLVLIPEQARVLITRQDSDTDSNPDAIAIVLWREALNTDLDATLVDHPMVVGVLDSSCLADTTYATLNVGLRRLQHRDGPRAADMLERVLEIGRALSSEKDLDTLLDLILTYARDLTNADGASIYTLDANGKLYFRLWQNFSTSARSSAQKTLVGKYSIAGYVARTGEVINVDDAYEIPKTAPYRFSPAVDSSIGYRTRSMLTVPLKNKSDEVVGILQLINRKDQPNVLLSTPKDVASHVFPFDEQSQSIALALAGQAGVALENSILYKDIERLFEGFITASVKAIEARDPTTAGHSFRVAGFTEGLAVAVDRADGDGLRDIGFTREQMTELRYAALLHDFGKVGVREQVLVKGKKLYSHQLETIKQRFKYAGATIARESYRKLIDLQQQQQLSPEEFAARRREMEEMLASEGEQLEEFLQVVLRMNEPTVSRETISGDLEAVEEYKFPGENGEELPLLQPFELKDLSLAKGSLNAEEWKEIKSHVTHTWEFLSLIPWTKNLRLLPEIAYAHHEKLDGSGYPRRLTSAEIPIQSKIMTIADIYDALTAPDRPYKASLPVEKALDILHAEAREGKVDPSLLKVFEESNTYMRTVENK
ncbi:MAG: GAF domain-containing protein [Gammaproteobacteria bacterium]|nr:GAF domain-containing protein [Gammaproteobacteria bacterium]